MDPMSSPAPESTQGPPFWLRWRLAILLAGGGALLLYALFLARGALFPFIISIVLAQLLHPVVAAVERLMPGRARYPNVVRVVAIVLIYLFALAIVGGFLMVTIPPVFNESQEFVETLPDLYERAHDGIESWSEDFTQRIPDELRSQLEDAVASGGDVLSSAALGVLRRTISGVSNAITLVIGLVIVPFFLFYLLKDRQEVVGGALSIFSTQTQERISDVLHIVNNVIGAYVRGQLFSALIVAVMVFIGLTILGIKFAAILAIVAGLFGLIPIVGAILGAVPGVLVALASSPQQALWVALVYIIVQLVESNIISPRIQSNAVRLHPAMVMIVLVCSSEVAGLWGMIVGVPLTAAVRDVFVYFYREWNGSSTALPAAASAAEVESGSESQVQEYAPTESEEDHEVD